MSHSSGPQERTPTSKEVLTEKAEGSGPLLYIQLTFPQKLERWPPIREPCAEIPQDGRKGGNDALTLPKLACFKSTPCCSARPPDFHV